MLADNNPQNTFDNFSYNVVDEEVGNIIALNDSLDRQLADNYQIPTKSELAIKDIYDKFGQKYHINISYKNFKEFLASVADSDKTEAQIIEAIHAKISTMITQRTNLKLMLTLDKLIERSTEAVLKQTENLVELDPVAVGMIDKAFQWRQQLQDIQDSYSEKISDPDKTIEKIIAKNKTDVKEAEDEKKETDLVNNILEALKSN